MSLADKIIKAIYMKCNLCSYESRIFIGEPSTTVTKILKEEGWTNLISYEKNILGEKWSCPDCTSKNKPAEPIVEIEKVVEEVKVIETVPEIKPEVVENKEVVVKEVVQIPSE